LEELCENSFGYVTIYANTLGPLSRLNTRTGPLAGGQ